MAETPKQPSDAPQSSDKRCWTLELPEHSTNELHPIQVVHIQYISFRFTLFQAGVMPYQLKPPALLLAPFALHPAIKLHNRPPTMINQCTLSTLSTQDDVHRPSQLEQLILHEPTAHGRLQSLQQSLLQPASQLFTSQSIFQPVSSSEPVVQPANQS